jgi:flagellar biosynthetic protein FliR
VGLARWVPITALCPFLGGRLVPPPVRLALALLFAGILLPALSAGAPLPLPPAGLLLAVVLLEEVLVGLVLGLGTGLLFWGAEMGGRLLDDVRGTSTANVLIPHERVQSSLLGDFYFQLFIVLYVLAGGHRLFLAAALDSYRLLPPFAAALRLDAVGGSFVGAVGETYLLAIRLIAPALLVIVLLDVILGVANRMAPQLDVFFLSLSLKSSLGALIVALGLVYLPAIAHDAFREGARWLHTTVAGLAAAG